MSERKPGWYWVKSQCDWAPTWWDVETGSWWDEGTMTLFEDDLADEIGQRIPTPDERSPTPCPDGGKCYKTGETCGDPICVKWHADLLAAPKPEDT